MIYRPDKIKWMHWMWREKEDFEFQTRRWKRENESLCFGDGCSLNYRHYENDLLATVVAMYNGNSWGGWNKARVKWQVGRDYAIQPGRGCYGVKVGRQAELILDPEAVMFDVAHRRLRMLVTDIGEEPLRDISGYDYVQEGIDMMIAKPGYAEFPWRLAFQLYWDGLKMQKGHRWADNPMVFPISFQLRAM